MPETHPQERRPEMVEKSGANAKLHNLLSVNYWIDQLRDVVCGAQSKLEMISVLRIAIEYIGILQSTNQRLEREIAAVKANAKIRYPEENLHVGGSVTDEQLLTYKMDSVCVDKIEGSKYESDRSVMGAEMEPDLKMQFRSSEKQDYFILKPEGLFPLVNADDSKQAEAKHLSIGMQCDLKMTLQSSEMEDYLVPKLEGLAGLTTDDLEHEIKMKFKTLETEDWSPKLDGSVLLTKTEHCKQEEDMKILSSGTVECLVPKLEGSDGLAKTENREQEAEIKIMLGTVECLVPKLESSDDLAKTENREQEAEMKIMSGSVQCLVPKLEGSDGLAKTENREQEAEMKIMSSGSVECQVPKLKDLVGLGKTEDLDLEVNMKIQSSGMVECLVPKSEGFVGFNTEDSELGADSLEKDNTLAHMVKTPNLVSYDKLLRLNEDCHRMEINVTGSAPNRSRQLLLPSLQDNDPSIELVRCDEDVNCEQRQCSKEAEEREEPSRVTTEPQVVVAKVSSDCCQVCSYKPYKCTVCSFSCCQAVGLKRHVDANHAEKSPRDKACNCSQCLYKSNRANGLIRHMATHTEESFKCTLCPYQCIDSGTLQNHMAIHAEDKPFKCIICSYKCRQSSSLKYHMLTHTGERSHKCTVCTLSFRRQHHLEKHIMAIHNKEKSHNCAICPYTSCRAGDLRKHLATHSSGKPFQCSECSARFSQIGSLKRHMANRHINNKDTNFKSSLSSYSYSQTSPLKIQEHMAPHTRQSIYKCSECPFVSLLPKTVKYHLTTHTAHNGKPFQCSQCSYGFTSPSRLKRHMLVHSERKPFTCSLCSFSSRQATNVKIHMATVHSADKPFQCGQCSYKCADKHYLSCHNRTKHLNQKPYGCAHCQHRTLTKRQLVGHLSK